MSGPAYRVETHRLVLRCWQPADAPLLGEAITASIDHLRPWIPWASDEPRDHGARVKLLRTFRAAFDSDRDFTFGIFDLEEGRVLGGTGLHPRIGAGGREIGYWIRADAVGQGLATEAAAALTRVAFEIDRMQRVEIRCNPENHRSRRVPEKLGFTHEVTLPGQAFDGRDELHDTMVWSLLRVEYPRSVAATAELAAFDVLGGRLL